MKKHTLLLAAFSLIALMSLTIVVDFLLPGEDKEEKILLLGSKAEAGTRSGGTAVSYLVNTASFSFTIDIFDFVKTNEGDTIRVNVSPLFNKVNKYQVVNKMDTPNMPVTRILGNMILPLLTIGLCIANYFFREIPQITWGGLVIGIATIVIFFI